MRKNDERRQAYRQDGRAIRVSNGTERSTRETRHETVGAVGISARERNGGLRAGDAAGADRTRTRAREPPGRSAKVTESVGQAAEFPGTFQVIEGVHQAAEARLSRREMPPRLQDRKSVV